MSLPSNNNTKHQENHLKIASDDVQRALFECEKIRIASFIRTRADELRSQFKHSRTKVNERKRFSSEPNIKYQLENSDMKAFLHAPQTQSLHKQPLNFTSTMNTAIENPAQKYSQSEKSEKFNPLHMRRASDNHLYPSTNQNKFTASINKEKNVFIKQGASVLVSLVNERLMEAFNGIFEQSEMVKHKIREYESRRESQVPYIVN